MSIQSSVMAQTRVASIDAIRIVALAAIVVGHVYVKSELGDRLIQSWRLPIFFMLSGYFWSRRRTVRDEVDKRWRQLIVPYLWWLALIAAFSLPVRLWRDPESLGDAITGVILGGSYATRPLTTFWFFTALFAATVFYRYLLRLPGWLRLSIVGAGLGANMLFGAELAAVPYSIATSLGALIFLEVGRNIRRVRDERPDRQHWWVAAGCFIAAAAILLTPGDFVPLDMKKGEFPAAGLAVALLIGTALVLVAVSVPPLGERLARWLAFATAPSLVVILIHPLVLWVLRPESGVLPLWLVAVLAFLLPLGLGVVLMRSRLAPALLGIQQRKPVKAKELSAWGATP